MESTICMPESCVDGERDLITAPQSKNKQWKRLARDKSKMTIEDLDNSSDIMTGKMVFISEEIQYSAVKRIKSSEMSGEDGINSTAVVAMQPRRYP